MARGSEHDPPGKPLAGEPLFPALLPPDMATFFRRAAPYACVTQATSEGVAYVIKTPSADLVTLRGTIPVGLRHELYEHPSAPVIRTVLTILDRPRSPLQVETFINVAAEDQRADFAALANQERLILLFYDEQIRHRLTKLVPYPDRGDVPRILTRATEIAAAIPPWRRDFDRAKAAVMQQTTL